MSEKIVQFNEEIIKGQLKELVQGSVEETLNELLEKEAESLTQAARYECSEACQGYRSGHYDRNLTTTSGDVTLHVPRLKGVSFETATPGGIAAGRAAWRRRSLRCTWQAFPCAGWRTSRRHCGAVRSRPPPSARGTMKAYTSICPLSDEYSPQGLNNGDVA